jgi:putative transcriptional regulator
LISFAPFWITLKNKEITQYCLINRYAVSTGTLDAIRKNKSVTLNTIQDLCRILDCDMEDIVIVTKD